MYKKLEAETNKFTTASYVPSRNWQEIEMGEYYQGNRLSVKERVALIESQLNQGKYVWLRTATKGGKARLYVRD